MTAKKKMGFNLQNRVFVNRNERNFFNCCVFLKEICYLFLTAEADYIFFHAEAAGCLFVCGYFSD